MIKNTLLYAIIALCQISIGGYSQENAETRRLRGTLVDKHDLAPVINAHIINLSRAMGTISYFDGSFSINIKIQDTLIIQALAYNNDTIVISGELFRDTGHILLALERRIYELSKVDIYPFGTYSQFKNAFVNFEHSETQIDLNLPRANFMPMPSSGGGIVIPGPITFLYEKFGQKGKNMRRYLYHSHQDELIYKASLVINHHIVRQLTHLEDDDEIDAFLSYCNMSEEFIVNTNKYLVLETLLTCYNAYKSFEKGIRLSD